MLLVQWVKPIGKSALPETSRQPKEVLHWPKKLHTHARRLLDAKQCHCVQWVKPKGKSALPETTWQPKDLLPRLKKLPSKRLLHVPNATVDALDFKLFFDPAGELPPGYSKPELGTWTVSGALTSFTFQSVPPCHARMQEVSSCRDLAEALAFRLFIDPGGELAPGILKARAGHLDCVRCASSKAWEGKHRWPRILAVACRSAGRPVSNDASPCCRPSTAAVSVSFAGSCYCPLRRCAHTCSP